ncbi:unnamed protein product [Brassica oleracea]|uniref:(rape) hypothetical protein n=1 Tax=Brassica napus TaxID=3708 RepID=A0A816JZ16_BRANA|nr:unnamed protein product [Brassica napus]
MYAFSSYLFWFQPSSMAEHCMVIAGKWETSAYRHWNFSIDKQHMTRIVPLRNGIPLTELLSNVFREFFDDADVFRTALLSYWPPNSKELASGLTTPPVCSQTTGLSPTFTSTFKLTRELICLSLSISNPNPIRLVMLMRILYLSLRPTNLSRRPTVPILRLHCDILQPLGLKYQASPFSTMTTSTCLMVVCLYTLR